MWIDKKENDRLGAREMNDLGAAAYRRRGKGSWLPSQVADSFTAGSGTPPFHVHYVEVARESTTGLYKVYLYYYDKSRDSGNMSSAGWRRDCIEYDLDARQQGLRLYAGQRVTAYWDDQRGTFVPCHPELLRVVLTENLVE